MKKNMFKRAWLNITRKKSKTIVLFIIMFVIANLVLASLAISNSVDESTQYAKESLGSEIYLNPDMEEMRNNFQNSRSEDVSVENLKSTFMDRPEVSVSIAEDVADSEYIKDYTYSVAVTYEPINFELIELEESNMMARMGGNNFNMITGINSYAFLNGVENNVIEISEGTYFDETTDNSVMISYELAVLNDLAVGDSLELQNVESEEVFDYEIVGIFIASEEGYENDIYMNIESATNLMAVAQYNDGDYPVSNVIYYLNDPENVDAFINDSNEKYDFEEMSLILDINNDAYEQMAGPLESVGSFSTTILVVVIIAAVLIIALIINNNIKDRKYEMGVLMSLGATKKNILGQILIELVLVATVGFILSIGTSSLLANGMSDSLLANQLEMNETQSENNFGRPSGGNIMPSFGKGTQDVEVIDEIDVNVNAGEYIMLFTIGYIIILVAMGLPAINIMKYEPKTILTGRE